MALRQARQSSPSISMHDITQAVMNSGIELDQFSGIMVQD